MKRIRNPVENVHGSPSILNFMCPCSQKNLLNRKNFFFLFIGFAVFYCCANLILAYYIPSVTGDVIDLEYVIPHKISNINSSFQNFEENSSCRSMSRSLVDNERGYRFMFDIFRSEEDEVIIMFAPDVSVKPRDYGNVNFSPKREIIFAKFIDNNPHSKMVSKEMTSTCVEKYESINFVKKTRYHIGTISPFIFRCKIPLEIGKNFRTFHCLIKGTSPNIYYHVQDCSPKSENFKNVKESRFSATVVSKMSIDDISHWLKYMHFIGFDHVRLLLDNPSREKFAFFLHNYPASFLSVWPRRTKSYRPFQTLALGESFLRHPSEWSMTNDIDEYPLFFPNLHEFVEEFEEKNPDVAGIELSVMLYSKDKVTPQIDDDQVYHGYPEIMKERTPIIRLTHPCRKGVFSAYEDRAKPIFKPSRIVNVENHYVCPKEGFRVYQSNHSRGFLNHYFGYDGRELPNGYPLNYDISNPEEDEKMFNSGLKPCYFEVVDKQKSSNIYELMIRYEQILKKCKGLLCEKNEIDLKDRKLMDLKKGFQITTTQRIKKGYSINEVSKFHETIIEHCRYERF